MCATQILKKTIWMAFYCPFFPYESAKDKCSEIVGVKMSDIMLF